MRLPWPFQRSQRAPAAPFGATEAAAARAPDRPPRGAWRELPPLAETVGPPPLTAPSEPFAADLAAPRAPTVLAELRHGRGLGARPGLVVGIARALEPAPVEATSPVFRGSEPLPTVRHRAAPVVPEGEGEPAHDLTHVPGAEGAQLALSPPGGTVGPPRAPRTAQRAAPAPAATPVPSHAESTTAVPQGSRGQSQAAPGPPGADRLGLAGSARPLTVTRMRRVGLGPPLGSETPPAQRSAPAASPVIVSRVRPATLGEAPSGPSQTEAAPPLPPAGSGSTTPGSTTPGSRPLVRQAQRLVEWPPPAQTDVPPAPPGVGLGPARGAPATELTGRAAAPATPPATPDALAAAPGPVLRPPLPSAPAGPSGRPARRPSEPRLLGRRPLTARIQRTPLTPVAGPEPGAPSAGPGDAAGGPDISAPVRIHRGEGVAEASAALGARAFTHDGEIYLPAVHGPLGSPPARSLLDHELTHVVQQRVLGSNLPAEESPRGRGLEAQAVAAEARRPAPLALPPGAGRRAASARALDGGGAASSATPTSSAAGEREPATEPATASVQRAAAAPDVPRTTSATAPPRGRKSEQELDELTRQLYGRLRSRLRQELLADRERAGLVTGR